MSMEGCMWTESIWLLDRFRVGVPRGHADRAATRAKRGRWSLGDAYVDATWLGHVGPSGGARRPRARQRIAGRLPAARPPAVRAWRGEGDAHGLGDAARSGGRRRGRRAAGAAARQRRRGSDGAPETRMRARGAPRRGDAEGGGDDGRGGSMAAAGAVEAPRPAALGAPNPAKFGRERESGLGEELEEEEALPGLA